MQPTVDAGTDVPRAPLDLPCGATLPGRIGKSAMSEQVGDRVNAPTRELSRLYESWGA